MPHSKGIFPKCHIKKHTIFNLLPHSKGTFFVTPGHPQKGIFFDPMSFSKWNVFAQCHPQNAHNFIQGHPQNALFNPIPSSKYIGFNRIIPQTSFSFTQCHHRKALCFYPKPPSTGTLVCLIQPSNAFVQH